MSNNNKIRYNKSRVERDSQMQTREYISMFEPLALCPSLYLEGFSLSPQKNFTKETVHSTRGGHKANGPLHKTWAQSQCSRPIHLQGSIKQIEGNKLGDYEDHKLEILQKQGPKREMIAQVSETTEIVEIKLLRKNLKKISIKICVY